MADLQIIPEEGGLILQSDAEVEGSEDSPVDDLQVLVREIDVALARGHKAAAFDKLVDAVNQLAAREGFDGGAYQ